MRPTDFALDILEGGFALVVVFYWMLFVWRMHVRATQEDRRSNAMKAVEHGLPVQHI